MAKDDGSKDEPAAPHPRARFDFVGHDEAERAFAEAIACGRLHHAWLIGGPVGIGKATLAYRVARRLLASPAELKPASGPLAVDPLGRTARQIEAGSHPNLMVLDIERASADVDKPPARTIGVKTVRRALSFFQATASDGGHRVCIVDSAEDLLGAGANALLKTVEEPPPRSTILIVSHAPHRVLPTIRSRCRALALKPLDEAAVTAVLETLPPGASGLDRETARQAAAFAEGSVRRALALLDPALLGIVSDTDKLLGMLPNPPIPAVLALAEKLNDRRADNLDLALDAVRRWTGERLRAGATGGAARLAPLAELCEKIEEAAQSVETYNLDRRPFIVTMFADLAVAVGRDG